MNAFIPQRYELILPDILFYFDSLHTIVSLHSWYFLIIQHAFKMWNYWVYKNYASFSHYTSSFTLYYLVYGAYLFVGLGFWKLTMKLEKKYMAENELRSFVKQYFHIIYDEVCKGMLLKNYVATRLNPVLSVLIWQSFWLEARCVNSLFCNEEKNYQRSTYLLYSLFSE